MATITLINQGLCTAVLIISIISSQKHQNIRITCYTYVNCDFIS